MRWTAFIYGLVLGAVQFVLLRALIGAALAAGRSDARLRLPGRVLGILAVYLAASLGAVYIFTAQLLTVGIGLGVGLVGGAVIAAGLALHRAAARDKQARR